ncbi:brevican core protein [Halichoerus grypus]|uniref:brevican core protein isoform X1 n=1 Tax=Halichoerus grypus TaxID=9711 RepID=UPI001658DDBB|nr:brevican core protein isoform X1 [Halichoerus grypus]XP_035974159.1 brevican core protein isoform X1 [Halichoerus grypus]
MALLFLLLLAALALTQGPAASADALEGDSSEDRAFRVRIAGDGPVQGVLGGALTIPCHLHYLRPPPSRRAVLGSPRVKWTFLSGGREAEVLVARGLRVKVSEAYRFRVALPAYPASLTDVSLVLSELRPNDSGIYRCEVQHGIDDSSDAVEVKVKGVVFLYRKGSARYAFSFVGAQEACARIGARIATPEQLYAAYLGGYEQCDAGWLSDQTVRYPIQTPREACYGDMDGFPGVRNYGVVDPDDLYDVYCYAEDLNGELFLGAPPDKLTLEEARAYCRERGAEIATTGQLYAAWDGGLDRCSPGWLADGSVRYPIVRPSQRCGGGLPGVKTLFLFPNQTGFPNKHSRFNVYCFRDSPQPSATPEASGPALDPASNGLEAIVTVTETLEELQLPRETVESESRGAIYSIPIVEDGADGSSTPEDPAEAPRTLLEFEAQSIVPPLGSSEEEGKALEEEEKYTDEEEKEEEEEEEVEDEALWAWPSELSSPDPETPLHTELALEESLSHASPPPASAVLQPGASPPPDGEPEAPRPPRVLGPPTETLPTPRNGKLASPPPSTPVGEREVGEEAGGPELSGVPRGENEETGSSEDTPALLPATRAPESARELEAPSEENSGRTVPTGTSVRVQPVLPTDSASQGGVAVAPSSGDCVPSPCHNGGTCLEEEEGIRCLCLPGYGGDLCDVGLRFCSPGWDVFQGACYKHFSTRSSWEEAETRCRMHGAHLASISTPEEQDFINSRYREYQWIGLNDRTIEGDFLWSDGVPLLYENWNPGQPDSYFLSGENCVVMVWHDQGQWSDVPCNYHLSYTCKMGLVSCGPPPELPLAQVFGRPRLRYEVDTVLRYQCREGLTQRNLPLIRCQENGHWEPPQISCVPRRPARALHPLKAPEGHQGRLLGPWKALLTPPSSPAPGP